MTLVPFGESITDGDRVPTTALVAPDGKPGLLARYFNPVTPPRLPFPQGTDRAAIAALTYQSRPVVSQREADVAARGLTLPSVNDYHRTEWTGFLVPPETGSYRLGLGGSGLLELERKTFLDVGADHRGPLPTLKTVTLQKGQRWPLRVVSTARGFGNTDLVWKLVSAQPDAALAAAAAQADVLVAVVGLTSDLEAEETGTDIPGFQGGDKTSLDLPAEQMAMLERAKATGKPVIVVAMNGSPINLAWAKDNAAAIVEAWYPGQTGGVAGRERADGQDRPGRSPAADLLPQRRGPAAVRQLRDDRADLSLFHRQAGLSVRSWAELHQLRLHPAGAEPGFGRRGTGAPGHDRRQQYRQARG